MRGDEPSQGVRHYESFPGIWQVAGRRREQGGSAGPARSFQMEKGDGLVFGKLGSAQRPEYFPQAGGAELLPTLLLETVAIESKDISFGAPQLREALPLVAKDGRGQPGVGHRIVEGVAHQLVVLDQAVIGVLGVTTDLT